MSTSSTSPSRQLTHSPEIHVIYTQLNQTAGMYMLFFMCRIIITIFQSKIDQTDNSNYMMTVLLHCIYGFILTYDSINQFPYHNTNVSKANGVFSAAYLWINTSFLLLQLSNIQMLHDNILVMVGLGLGFFIKLFLNIRNYYVKVLMNSELDSIQSDILLDIKLRTYNNLAKTLDFKKSELILASLLKIHYDKCADKEMCPCRKRTTLFDPKKEAYGDADIQLHRDRVFVKHFLTKMINDGIEKFRDSKLLQLDLMFYRFESLRIYSSIYFEIIKFESRYHNDMSLSIEFCLYRLGEMLKGYISMRNQSIMVNEKLKIENVRRFDEGIILLRKYIMTINRNFNDLWESLQDLVPDLGLILDIGNKCINNIQITNALYEELILLNSQSQDLKNLMDIYASHLVFDELLSFKVSKDITIPTLMEVDSSIAMDLEQAIKKYNIFDANSCVLTISPRMENMGQVLWCSRNVTQIFGYSPAEMLTLNIAQVIPEPISFYHPHILKHFYDKGREKQTKSINHAFALDIDKVCFSINLNTKIIPTSKCFDIMGFIHKLNSEDYMVTDSDGMLNGVGSTVAKLIDLSPAMVADSNFNIQILAPTLMSLYKKYFVEFDDVTTDLKPHRVQDLKFTFFIPMNVQTVVKSFVDFRSAIFKKYHIDPITKEHLNKQGLNIKQMIQQMLEFKSAYAHLLHRMNRKINIQKLRHIVKVRAQVSYFSFFNGEKQSHLYILKLLSYEIKNTEYIAQNSGKLRTQEQIVSKFIVDLKKEHNEYKAKKMRMQAEVEKEDQDEFGLKANGEESAPISSPMKGYANLLRKQGKKGNQFFQKMRKVGSLVADTDQQENSLKGAILMTMFKTSNRRGKTVTKQKSNIFQSNSKDLNNIMTNGRGDWGSDSPVEQDLKKIQPIEVTQEHIDKMKQCSIIPRIFRALHRAKIVGLSEFSGFHIKDIHKANKNKGAARLAKIIKSNAFKRYRDTLKRENSESSGFEDEREKHHYQGESDQEEDSRDILQALGRKEHIAEEKDQVQASVSGSTSSLQTFNALRVLRESIKQIEAPNILITANYCIITQCIMIGLLIILQYEYVKQGFIAIEQELYMYTRVSHYSESIGQLYNGYLSLEMINSGTLTADVYNSTWQDSYREELIGVLSELVEFFLRDFSQAGMHSQNGNDMRAYLFQHLNVSTLINKRNEILQINFETYVRLFTNAVNQTIELPLQEFSHTPSSDYFNFIKSNFGGYSNISESNFHKVSHFIVESLDQQQQRFILFWVFSFIIVMLCYLFIYPILLETKIKIHETLRIFTKISLKDVEHYLEHYKKILLNFKTIQDSSELITKIEEEVLTSKQLYLHSKAHDSKSLSRSRNYKGIRINKVLFFIAMTLWLSLFITLILVKDIFMLSFIQEAYNLNQLHLQETQTTYMHQHNFYMYREMYHKVMQNQTIDRTQVVLFMNQLQQQDVGNITKVNLIAMQQYSPLYTAYVENLLTEDLCQGECPPILAIGFINFYLQLQMDMVDGLELLLSASTAQALEEIQMPKYREYLEGLQYIKKQGLRWQTIELDTIMTGINQQITYNLEFVVLISVLIFLFLVFIWIKEYNQLKRSSKWVNGFILLIPINILKENQYMKTYLKKTLKVQNLQNI